MWYLEKKNQLGCWKGRSLLHETELERKKPASWNRVDHEYKLAPQVTTDRKSQDKVSFKLFMYLCKRFTGIIKYCLYFCFLGTLYDGEKFQLEFKFGSKYPFESPEVKMIFPVSPCRDLHFKKCGVEWVLLTQLLGNSVEAMHMHFGDVDENWKKCAITFAVL